MAAAIADGFSTADWNLYAKCYDALLELRPYQELLSIIAKELDLQDEDSVLDAGCGTGNLLQRLSALQKKVSLFGVDLSPQMLAAAEKKCAEPVVALSRGSLNEKLPYNDASFTKVSSVNVLYAVADPAFTLQELHRVLRPKGRLVLVTPKKEYDNGLILKSHAQSEKQDAYWKNIHASLEREESLVREAIEDEKIIEMMLLVAHYNRFISRTVSFHFLTESELGALVSESGFDITSMHGVYADQCLMVTAARGE